MSGRSTRRSARTSKKTVVASEKGKKRGARKRKRSPASGEAADPSPSVKRRKAAGDKEVGGAAQHAAIVAPQARNYLKERRPVVLKEVGGEPFWNPCSICGTENGSIVCVDRAAIRTFTREGELLHKAPVETGTASHLASPQIASLPGGRLVVALDDQLKIVEADGTERLISEWAPPDPVFLCPAVIPSSGNIVVGNGIERALFVVSQAGELLRTIPTPFRPFPFTVTSEGTIVVASDSSAVLHMFSADGEPLPDVAFPPGVCWRRLAGDHSGNIIGSTTTDHVVVIQKDGTELYRVGGKGRGKGAFKCLSEVGVLPDGTILACDPHGNCVKLL